MSERLANALKTARGARGWTHKRLRDESGVSLDTIVRLEGDDPGCPQAATLAKLALALELSLDSLVSAAAQPTTGQPNVDGSALIHAPTADTPAEKQVSDMRSKNASTIKPTAGRPRRSSNSGKALGKTG